MRIKTDEIKAKAPLLTCGDEVLLTGYVYTARDAAHKKLRELAERGEKLPFRLDGSVIYYAGPTPAPPGRPVGSCGPTTSGRMDPYTPDMLDAGLAAVIGKGARSEKVKEAFVRNGAVYFCAIGGAGALAAKCIKSLEVVAFPELGCESVKKLYIEDFPVYCGIDVFGGDIYEKQKGK